MTTNNNFRIKNGIEFSDSSTQVIAAATATSQLINDSGYLTSSTISAFVPTLVDENYNVQIGLGEGSRTQGSYGVAIGSTANNGTQGDNAIAIGRESADYGPQGQNAIAIGYGAGSVNQGVGAIAIGTYAGSVNQTATSIVISALGSDVQAPEAGLYITPVREQTLTNVVYYDPTTFEMTYGATGNPFNQTLNNNDNVVFNQLSFYVDETSQTTAWLGTASYNVSDFTNDAGYINSTLAANINLNGYNLNGGSYAGNTIELPTGFGPIISSRYEDAVTIQSSANNTTFQQWKFRNNGELVFPDATVQTTAWTGTIAYSNITNIPEDVDNYATTATVNNLIANSLTNYVTSSSLATVATSGSYNDLSNKPSIPSAYTLTTATASVLGGVKIGSGLSITGDGTISASGGSFPAQGGTFTGTVVTKAITETVYSWGNVGAGTYTIDASSGTVHKMTLTGNVTINGFTTNTTGSGATIIITQDSTGSRILTSSAKFAGGAKTLSTNSNSIDVITLFYDGTNTLGTLVRGFA